MGNLGGIWGDRAILSLPLFQYTAGPESLILYALKLVENQVRGCPHYCILFQGQCYFIVVGV